MYYINHIDPIFGKGTIPNTTNTKASGTYNVWFSPLETEIVVMADIENKVVLPSQHLLYKRLEDSYLTILPQIHNSVSQDMIKERLEDYASLDYLKNNLRLTLINLHQVSKENSIILQYIFDPHAPVWFVCLDKNFNVTSTFLGG